MDRQLAGRREWTALAVLALPLLLVSMDVSVLYFAVPFITTDLHASATQQLWIFDVYGFVLAGLLIPMGAFGDRIGRRKLLLLGAAGFGIASVVAAFAASAGQLIAARAVLGVAGATLMPSSLALLRTIFPDDRQRTKAIAVWSAVLTGGVALGPVLSGVLLEHFWWGSVFLINVPAMVLLLALAPVLLPEHRGEAGRPMDLIGAGLSLGTVLPVVFGIKRFAAHGTDTLAGAAIALGVLLGAAFVARQRRAAHPMIELTLFARREFSGGLLANLVGTFALIGNAVFVTQYLQLVLGMSPLRAALWSVLPAVAVGGAAPLAAALSGRFGRGAVVTGGLLVAAGGFGVLTRITVHSPLLLPLVGAGVLACGLVAVLSVVADLVLAVVRPERAGAASALMETSSEFGGALGIAVLGSIGTAVYRARIGDILPPGLPVAVGRPARSGLADALGAAGGLGPSAHDALIRAAREAFTSGYAVVAVVGAAILVAAAALSLRLLRPAPASPAVPPEAVGIGYAADGKMTK